MLTIGIAHAEELLFTKDMITALLELSNLKVTADAAENADAAVFIIKKGSFNYPALNILIINAEEYLDELRGISVDYLIVDSDNKNLLKNLDYKKGVLLTCGLNPKSSITASSVTEDARKTIQVCIQRSFKTINNNTIDEQEFSLFVPPNASLFSVLSSVAGILICGVKIENIS